MCTYRVILSIAEGSPTWAKRRYAKALIDENPYDFAAEENAEMFITGVTSAYDFIAAERQYPVGTIEIPVPWRHMAVEALAEVEALFKKYKVTEADKDRISRGCAIMFAWHIHMHPPDLEAPDEAAPAAPAAPRKSKATTKARRSKIAKAKDFANPKVDRVIVKAK